MSLRVRPLVRGRVRWHHSVYRPKADLGPSLKTPNGVYANDVFRVFGIHGFTRIGDTAILLDRLRYGLTDAVR
jgi:hypothetical protein